MQRRTWGGAAPRTDEDGQTMVEYAVVLAVITIAIVVGFMTLGNSAGSLMDKVTTYL
ncbi:MAG: Flp/Fap pilin component [Thermoleophilia bacterium]|nr:Flp/Fap pilin component [Thermoleophilia bacterium]